MVENTRLQKLKILQSRPDYLDLVDQLKGADVLTKEELRQLILPIVEKIDPNRTMLGVNVRLNVPNAGQFARVTFRFPTIDGDEVFLTRQHRSSHKGQKGVIPCDCELHKGVVNCQGEASKTRPYFVSIRKLWIFTRSFTTRSSGWDSRN